MTTTTMTTTTTATDDTATNDASTSDAAVRTQPDPERLEAFTNGVVADIKGHQAALMACFGDHLGLFDALAAGPATSSQLAERTGLDERQVREWLAGMTAAQYVTHDPAAATFNLTPEQAAVLAAEDTPVSMGGVFHELVGIWDVFTDVTESFRTGDGIELDRYPASWWDGMERFTGADYATRLLQAWVPGADGIEEALADGARIAEVGCGRGRALATILQAYDDATAIGYDLSPTQLEGARRVAEEAGVADRVEFRLQDAAEGLEGPFDLVTSFDVVHDLVDVDGVFAAIHDALAPDGSFLLLDFDVAERLDENITPIATILYGFSLVYCLPTSLAGDGDALGTCGLPPSEVRARATTAGFDRVTEIPIESPFNRLYQLQP